MKAEENRKIRVEVAQLGAKFNILLEFGTCDYDDFVRSWKQQDKLLSSIHLGKGGCSCSFELVEEGTAVEYIVPLHDIAATMAALQRIGGMLKLRKLSDALFNHELLEMLMRATSYKWRILHHIAEYQEYLAKGGPKNPDQTVE